MRYVRSSTALSLVIFVGFLACYGVYGVERTGWSDDGAAYILHAKNLLQGRPYADIGVSATPNYHEGGLSYPPMLPLLLVPFVRFLDTDLAGYKLFASITLAASLALLPFVLRDRMTRWASAAVVLAFGANIETYRLVQHLNSDFLFLLLFFVFLLVMRRGFRREDEHRPVWPWLLLAAALVFSLAMVRSTAIALPPGLLFFLLLTRRRGRFGWLVAAISVPCVMLTMFLWSGGYRDSFLFYFSFASVRRNLIQYPLRLGELFGGGPALTVVLGILAGAGAISVWRRQPRLWDCIAIFFAGLLVIWPFRDPYRFAMPLIPLVFAYLIEGVQLILNRLGPRTARAAWLAVAAATAVSFIRVYAAEPRPGEADGILTSETQRLWTQIRRSTAADARIVFIKARSLTFLTGRRGILYSPLVSPRQFWAEVCPSRPTHVVAAPAIFEDDQLLLEPALRDEPDRVREVYRSDHFVMYEVRSTACENARPVPRLRLPSRWGRAYPLP